MSGPARFELQFVVRQEGFTLALDHQGDARVLALFGPSGSGKTTCLEVVAGLRRPWAGRVAIGGRELFSDAAGIDVPARERGIGYVPQDALLFPHLDVRRNILFGADRQRTSHRVDLDAVLSIVEAGPLIDRQVAGLSGGERQRVALARALMSGPDLLLLDEPLAGVDLPLRRRIVSSLRRIRDEMELPAIYVTHDPAELRLVADAVIVLDEGRVIASGPASTVDEWMEGAHGTER